MREKTGYLIDTRFRYRYKVGDVIGASLMSLTKRRPGKQALQGGARGVLPHAKRRVTGYVVASVEDKKPGGRHTLH